MLSLVKISQAVSEKTYKNYAILYIYRAQGQHSTHPDYMPPIQLLPLRFTR